MNNRPRTREKERCKLIRKYGYADYYIKVCVTQKAECREGRERCRERFNPQARCAETH